MRIITLTNFLLVGAISANIALGWPLADGVTSPLEMNDGTEVSALWFDLTDITFQMYWNPTTRTPVVRFPETPKPQPYKDFPDALRRRIDDAVAFAGHGPDTVTVAKRHTFRRPLEIRVQLVVGLAADRTPVLVPVPSLSPDGYEALEAAFQQIRVNYEKNEPLREQQRTRWAVESAQMAAEDALREARRARRAAEDAEWEARTMEHRLRGFGLIP